MRGYTIFYYLNIALYSFCSNGTGKSSFLAKDIECYSTSDCEGPYGPICLYNECRLICADYHQTQSSDGNCTLAVSTLYSKQEMILMPWMEAVGNIYEPKIN